MAKAKCNFRIGTSGWHYGHWAGPFYPAALPKDKWFAYYAKNFDTVEINNTFYHLPREETFRNWCKQAPAGFLFAVKANRYITHIKRLKDPQEVLERFFERVRLLKKNLGPILYQLPPSLHKDLAPLERRPSILRSSTKDESFLTGLDRLEAFLQVLRNVILNPSLCSRTGSAKRSEESLPRRPRSVFEFRHESWYCEDTFELLRRFGVGFCIHAVARPSWPCLHGLEARATPRVVTGDIIYVRFHGTTGRYSGCYSKSMLANFAKWLKEQSRNVCGIYVYFNNDEAAYAVRNAKELRELLCAS